MSEARVKYRGCFSTEKELLDIFQNHCQPAQTSVSKAPMSQDDATIEDGADSLGRAKNNKKQNQPRSREEAALQIQSVKRGRSARKDLDARSQVFARYDADQDGFLNEQEMLAFARCLGYDGGRQAWSQEFRALCGEHGWNPAVGLDAAAFRWLTTNTEDQYWFDAGKLSEGGWAAAAGHPVEVDIAKLTPRTPVTPLQRGLGPPSPAQGVGELEVPLQAKITGLNWGQLVGNEKLKESMIQRICSTIAQKAGVNVEDLRVAITASPM